MQDVLTHALCDAILGALGQGDIGRHFPDNDAAYKDIRSTILLERVVEFAHKQHLSLANADITIICQAPKLAPYIEKMRATLAACCRVTAERINIKATTTEKMGYTGRQEGISLSCGSPSRTITRKQGSINERYSKQGTTRRFFHRIM